eukprot:TRINITY_DN917_c0_g2_i1.p1 TRINITY_DN917_c0_g2~~TRINITY_DN917_c0_g2_i1.p1  ORF type:complete len:1294 (+),score=407.22 TRINITY_DN917_c0_g2_i1:132-4013(+)
MGCGGSTQREQKESAGKRRNKHAAGSEERYKEDPADGPSKAEETSNGTAEGARHQRCKGSPAADPPRESLAELLQRALREVEQRKAPLSDSERDSLSQLIRATRRQKEAWADEPQLEDADNRQPPSGGNAILSPPQKPEPGSVLTETLVVSAEQVSASDMQAADGDPQPEFGTAVITSDSSSTSSEEDPKPQTQAARGPSHDTTGGSPPGRPTQRQSVFGNPRLAPRQGFGGSTVSSAAGGPGLGRRGMSSANLVFGRPEEGGLKQRGTSFMVLGSLRDSDTSRSASPSRDAAADAEREVLKAIGHDQGDGASGAAAGPKGQGACSGSPRMSPRTGPQKGPTKSKSGTGHPVLDRLVVQASTLAQYCFDSNQHVPKVMKETQAAVDADGAFLWSWDSDEGNPVIAEFWSSDKGLASEVTADDTDGYLDEAPLTALRRKIILQARDNHQIVCWPEDQKREASPAARQHSAESPGESDDLVEAVALFTGACVAVPVLFGGSVIGVAATWWRRKDAPGRTNPNCTAFVDAFAQLAGESLRSKRLLAKAVQQQHKAQAMLSVAESLGHVDLGGDTGGGSGVGAAIMKGAQELVDADRCYLFVVHHTRGELQADAEDGSAIILPMGSGVVGHVAETGEIVNLEDATADPRFHEDESERGYKTKSMLCVPVYNEGKIVAVAQLINKVGAPCFSSTDIDLFDTFGVFAGLALRNGMHYNEMLRQRRMTEVVLQMVRQLAETDIRSINNVTEQVISGARELCHADRCALFLVNEEHHELVTKIGDGDDVREIRVPIGVGIVGDVARTGEPVNIPDAYQDPRFNQEIDRKTGYRTTGIVAYPIQHKGAVVAVAQLINKMDPRAGVVPFETEDEDLLMVFSEFAGVAIGNARLYEFVLQAGNQAMDLFAQMQGADSGGEKAGSKAVRYATAEQAQLLRDLEGSLREDEIDALETVSFPIHDYGQHNQDRLVPLIVIMLRRMGLIELFKLSDEMLYSMLATVRNMYRPVPYHNFIHAFDVTQTLYYFMNTLGVAELLSDIERLAMMLCGVFHDIDHMGLNNSFHLKAETPLGLLSSASGSRSVLEVHHCSIAIEILSNDSTNVLSPLAEADSKQIFKVLINTILATDMARHGELMGELKAAAEAGPLRPPVPQEHKARFFSFLMKCADISNPCKPFETAKRWGIKVTEEFHSQGEQEKRTGVSTLPAVLLAGGHREFAKGQEGFSSHVVLPMVQLFSTWVTALRPMYEVGEANRSRWRNIVRKDVAAHTWCWCVDSVHALLYVYYFKLSQFGEKKNAAARAPAK